MYQSLRIIIILLCGIILASCSKSNQPDSFATFPSEEFGNYVDWIVTFHANSVNESTGMVHYLISLDSVPIDDYFPVFDVISLSINNTNVEILWLPTFPDYHGVGSIELPPNTEVQISLHGYKHHDEIHSCSLKMVDLIKNFQFTRLRDPQGNLTFNWTLNSNSPYQHLRLGEDPGTYFIELNPGLRSYTMPKSLLNYFFSIYNGYIALVESNYCLKDRILFRSISNETIQVQEE
ncbi:MAG TPA: hypothetical protein PLX59_04385 [Candidatus Cloacimonadota bacterium]|nr:hypothetical protein [Candidatus Cloacimonadota bacterium]